jgi:ketosteroid isomerase-like protein
MVKQGWEAGGICDHPTISNRFEQAHHQKFHSWKLVQSGIFVLRWQQIHPRIPGVRLEVRTVRKIMVAVGVLLWGVALAMAGQQSVGDDGGWVLALEKAWNHALEAKDSKALEMLLANTLVSIDIDGSVSSKIEFLASIKSPDYQPSQVVTEQSNVQVYGDAAVVVGIFRVKGTEKGKPYVHRERFVDSWIKTNGTWQCVATTSTLITAKQTAD